MALRRVAESYLAGRQVSQKYRESVLRVALELADVELSVPGLNRWLESMEGVRASRTIRTRKIIAGILWRAAFEAGIAGPPGPLRRIRIQQTVPMAWTGEQISALFEVADRQTIPGPLWWGSLLRAHYDTGLRMGDLLSVERGWIWVGGYLSIVQRKTGRSHQARIRSSTLEMIDVMLAGRKTGPIWPLWCHERNFWKSLRRIIDVAGLPGSGRWIRRASASYVERDRPGMGWRHLGHAAPGLAERSYLDPRIVAPEPTLPPALPGG